MITIRLFEPEEVARMTKGEHISLMVNGQVARFGFAVVRQPRQAKPKFPCTCGREFAKKLGLSMHVRRLRTKGDKDHGPANQDMP